MTSLTSDQSGNAFFNSTNEGHIFLSHSNIFNKIDFKNGLS